MKKTLIIIMINFSFLSFAEENTEVLTTSKSAIEVITPSETLVEIKNPEKTINDILKEKEYLKEYIAKYPEIFPIYNDKKELSSVKFSNEKNSIIVDFYSFDENKISKISKKIDDVQEFREYFENGNIKKLEMLYKGTKNIEEYNSEKKLIKKEKITKNKQSYELYYENGKLKEKGQFVFVNGLWEKNDVWEEYYESGRLKTSYLFAENAYYEISYVDDENSSKNYEGMNSFIDGIWYKDGLWTFYDNGKLSYRAEFFKEKGKFYNYYDEETSLVSVETSVIFLDNEWVWQGQKVFYSNNGKILEKQFKEGNRLGITGYYENSKNSIRYKGERDLSKTNFEKIGTWIYFGEDEKIQEVIEYDGNKAKIKEYFDFENNKLKFSGEMIKKGEYYGWIGLETYYNKNGDKETEINYTDDGRGKLTQYFENGKIAKEGEVFSDFIQNPSYYVGKMKEYDKNGKLKAEYNYDKGVLEGEILYYDTNGKLSVKKLYKNGELLKIENIK